ncbi:hypothetical protein HZR84_13740 [Hyphobacterium sp. CCMP332]|nr:hypothetical protein HZR84_13740 [Hyphobacterium sp. CCMP332]
MSLKVKWLIYSIGGLILCGFGISLVGEAIIAKIQNGSWFYLGTAGLVVFNSGLSFFGQAVIFRSKMQNI